MAEFHLPTERPDTPLSPVSTVLFRRDPDFVSRDTLLDQTHEKGSIAGSRVALVGLGGVGFRDIADYAKIPGRQDPGADIFKLTENLLRDEKKGKWTLILDNIDDDWFVAEFLATGREGPANGRIKALTRPLLDYLPRSSNGSIIIITRTKEVALKIVEHKDLIKVEPMARPETLDLIQKKVDLFEASQEILELVEELEFMPLAIVQAAAYIRHRAPRRSISQYLEKLRKGDGVAIRLLNYEGGHLYRDWEAKNAISATWQISFDHIRRIRPFAADILSLMSFFDRHAIPENMIRVQHQRRNDPSNLGEVVNESSEEEMDTASEFDADQDFEDDIATLRDHSFISFYEDRTVFTMHRLVQLTTRVWLKAHGQTEHWREQFVNKLCQEFPTGEYEDWGKYQSLFPHVKSALLGAWYARESGKIADMKEMASNSREQRVRLFGIIDDETLNSTEMLATAYWVEARWKEAEMLSVQVMETRR
ncbi:unnamed protein product [Penicillium salamii]|nr:unnamed protein product [Penicillium salamii]CAG8328088.1 unnamed protein product [Penicillium salamii]